MGDGNSVCGHPFVNLCDRFATGQGCSIRYTNSLLVTFSVLYHERRKFGEGLHLDVYA